MPGAEEGNGLIRVQEGSVLRGFRPRAVGRSVHLAGPSLTHLQSECDTPLGC